MKNKVSSIVREYKGFVLFLFLMVMFRSAIADWNDVPSGSMLPTIMAGDRILVNKLAYDVRVPLTHVSLYRIAEPRRGDIVIFDSHAADIRLVKRVIGIPGDTVQMIDNRLIVNGAPAEYDDFRYDDDALLATESIGDFEHVVRFELRGSPVTNSFGPVTVPEEHFLVLGDNRQNSADSRVYGFVPREEIVGRSRTVVLSLDRDNFFLPRADRFIEPM
jgi:signal peptidase I